MIFSLLLVGFFGLVLLDLDVVVTVFLNAWNPAVKQSSFPCCGACEVETSQAVNPGWGKDYLQSPCLTPFWPFEGVRENWHISLGCSFLPGVSSCLTSYLDYTLWSKTKFMEKKHLIPDFCFLSASNPAHRPELFLTPPGPRAFWLRSKKFVTGSREGKGALVR